jgi:hypothetical protein
MPWAANARPAPQGGCEAAPPDAAESPEGGAEPLTRPMDRTYVPSILRQPGMPVPPVTRASGAHLEPVEPEGERKIPKFLRRHGVGVAHDQPIARDWEPSEGPQADQPSGFVPSIVRRDQRDGLVTPPITPSQAPPVAASVTPDATGAPVAGSICPTCSCRVPARESIEWQTKLVYAKRRDVDVSRSTRRRFVQNHFGLKMLSLRSGRVRDLRHEGCLPTLARICC